MTDEVALNFISADEAWIRFDTAAQELLGMTGQEFASLLDDGDIEDLPQSPSMRVAMLRPEAA